MADSSASSGWLPFARRAGVLVAAVLVVYGRLWWAGFIWDDDAYVIDNQCLRSLDGLRAIWLEPSRTPQYYPLTHTSFWMEYQLWRLHAPLYHFVNVLIHAANAVLLWAVLRQLAVPGAWLGAALFALHPVEVETVAWITERKNTLSAFFGLAFLLAWLRYRFGAGVVATGQVDEEGSAPLRLGWLAVAVGLFVASLLCKTVTITLIGVVLVISWWKTGRLSARDMVGVAPLLGIGLPLAVNTAILEKQHVGAVGVEWALTAADRVVLAGRAIVFYLTKLLWPQPLLFFYPRWEVSATVAWQWVFSVAVVGVLAGLWAVRDRVGRGPLAAALIFVGMLFPALGFFDVFPFQYSFVADHFQYHASAAALAGLAAAATLAVARLSDARARLPLLVAWVGVLACLTAAQTRIYIGREPLYRHVLAHDPKSFNAANNLGTFCADHKGLVEAQALLEAAVENARFDRQKGLALWNLCLVTSVKRDDGGLLARAREAHRLVPTKASRSMLALGLVRNGQVEEAAAVLEDTAGEQAETRVSGEHVQNAYHLAQAEVAEALGDREEAIAQLEALLRQRPTACMGLQVGLAFARLGLGDRAVKVFGALRDHPVLGGSAYSRLGLIALERGNSEIAASCFQDAVDRDATLVEPYVQMAGIHGRERRYAEAEACLVEALKRAPDDRAVAEALEKIRAERAASAKDNKP